MRFVQNSPYPASVDFQNQLTHPLQSVATHIPFHPFSFTESERERVAVWIKRAMSSEDKTSDEEDEAEESMTVYDNETYVHDGGMKVDHVLVTFTPNATNRPTEIRVHFVPRFAVRGIHRFRLVLPGCVSALDIPQMRIYVRDRPTIRVRASWEKRACAMTFSFVSDGSFETGLEGGTAIRLVAPIKNHVVLPKDERPTGWFGGVIFTVSTVLGTHVSSCSPEHVQDVRDDDVLSDISDDESRGIENGVAVVRRRRIDVKMSELELASDKAKSMKETWIDKEQRRHKDLKHAASDAVDVEARLDRDRRHREICREMTRMIKRHFLERSKRRYFTIYSIILQRVARGMMGRYIARRHRSARRVQSQYRGVRTRRWYAQRQLDLRALRRLLLVPGFLRPKDLSNVECVCRFWRCQMSEPRTQRREWKQWFERIPDAPRVDAVEIETRNSKEAEAYMSFTLLSWPRYLWKGLYVAVHMIQRLMDVSDLVEPPPISSKHSGGFRLEEMDKIDPSEIFWRLQLHSMPDTRPEWFSVLRRKTRDLCDMIPNIACLREWQVLRKHAISWLDHVMANSWKYPEYELIDVFIERRFFKSRVDERRVFLRKAIEWGCLKSTRGLLRNRSESEMTRDRTVDLQTTARLWAKWTFEEIDRMKIGIVKPATGFPHRRRGILSIYRLLHDGETISKREDGDIRETTKREVSDEKMGDTDQKEVKEWTPPWRHIGSPIAANGTSKNEKEEEDPFEQLNKMTEAVRIGLRDAERSVALEMQEMNMASAKRVDESQRATDAAVRAVELHKDFVAASLKGDDMIKQVNTDAFEKLTRLRNQLHVATLERDAIAPRWVAHLDSAANAAKNYSYLSNTQWRLELVNNLNMAALIAKYDDSAMHLRSATKRIVSMQNFIERDEMLNELRRLRDSYRAWEWKRNVVYRSKCIRVETLVSRIGDIERMRSRHLSNEREVRSRFRKTLTDAITRSEELASKWSDLNKSDFIARDTPQTSPRRSKASSIKQRGGTRRRHDTSRADARANRRAILRADLQALCLEVRARGSGSRDVRTKYMQSLRRYSGKGDVVSASVVYADLVRRGVKPDINMFRVMIAACKNSTPCQPHFAVRLLDDALERGMRLKIKHFNSVVDVCAKDAEDARETGRFDSHDYSDATSLSTYEYIVEDIERDNRRISKVRTSQWRLALLAFAMMERAHVEASSLSYDLLIRSAANAVVDDAPKMYEAMKKQGIPESVAYASAGKVV